MILEVKIHADTDLNVTSKEFSQQQQEVDGVIFWQQRLESGKN